MDELGGEVISSSSGGEVSPLDLSDSNSLPATAFLLRWYFDRLIGTLADEDYAQRPRLSDAVYCTCDVST